MGVNALPEVMEVGELVDAALVGFDRRESTATPTLHVAARWGALDTARQALLTIPPSKRSTDHFKP